MSDKPKIILNNVFPDATYNTGNNLYHETINLFRADDEADDDRKYYIYLNAGGTYKGEESVDVLNVAHAGKGLYQILSIAKNCTVFAGAERTGKDKGEERYGEQKNKIKYGGLYVEKYFEENVTTCNAGEKDLFVTFVCDSIKEPEDNIYIAFRNYKGITIENSNKKKSVISKNLSVIKFSSKCRIVLTSDDDDTKEDLIKLRELLKTTKWKEIGSYDDRIKDLSKKLQAKDINYFSILGDEKRELAYSNAIAKILKYKENCISEFLSCLEIKNCENNSFEGLVLREKEDVDLLFRDLNQENGKIVIIENKIDAGLTLSDPQKKDLKEQASGIFCDVFGIKDYEKHSKLEEFNSFLSIERGGQHSQLSKYYIYALCWALKAGWSAEQIKNNIYCFFLCPEYHKNVYETDDDDMLNIPYAFANKYKCITYKRIKDIFNKIFDKQEMQKLTDNQKFIVQGFLAAVSDLAKERDDSIEVEMIRRFIERHDKLQKLKNK